MGPLAWSWAKVVDAKEADVTMDNGKGLEGPEWGGGPLEPWLVLLWRLEDWLPLWHPTPSLFLGLAPL